MKTLGICFPIRSFFLILFIIPFVGCATLDDPKEMGSYGIQDGPPIVSGLDMGNLWACNDARLIVVFTTPPMPRQTPEPNGAILFLLELLFLASLWRVRGK